MGHGGKSQNGLFQESAKNGTTSAKWHCKAEQGRALQAHRHGTKKWKLPGIGRSKNDSKTWTQFGHLSQETLLEKSREYAVRFISVAELLEPNQSNRSNSKKCRRIMRWRFPEKWGTHFSDDVLGKIPHKWMMTGVPP